MGCWNKTSRALLVLLAIVASTEGAHSEVLYKRYYVHNVNGRDVLSEPYTVRPNDFVIRLLKQKGEISHTNFPLFLNLFKLINNQIPDINRIHPGQRIFIPLKWLESGALPGQRRGIVDLPFITAAPVKQLLSSKTTAHSVKPGDSVSRLIANQFGPTGSHAYQEGIKLFRLVNPNITDLNRIAVGQTLKIPDAAVLDEAWYTSVFDANGEVILNAEAPEPTLVEEKGETHYKNETGTKDPFNALATLMGGVLLNRGRYYFPDADGKDFSINLSETPILQLPEGRRILFVQNGTELSSDKRRIMTAHFANLRFSDTSAAPTLPLLLDAMRLTYPETAMQMPLTISEEGLKLSLTAQWAFKYDRTEPDSAFRGLLISEVTTPSQRLPLPLANYLRKRGLVLREALQEEALPPVYFATGESSSAQVIVPTTHKVYVEALAKALGLLYDPNVSISFNYAGVQLEASANMIRNPQGQEALVDFGELYGDAVFAMESSGLTVVSIGKDAYLLDATLGLLTKLGIPFEKNPRIDFGEPGTSLRCALTVDGILVRPTPLVKKLIVASRLPDEILVLLEENGFGIIQIR